MITHGREGRGGRREGQRGEGGGERDLGQEKELKG